MTIAEAERLENQAAAILEKATAAARASGRLSDSRYSLLSTPESAVLLAEAHQIRRELGQVAALNETVAPPTAKAVPPAMQASIAGAIATAMAARAVTTANVAADAARTTPSTETAASDEEDRLVATILGISVPDLHSTAALLRNARLAEDAYRKSEEAEAEALAASILAA